MTLPCACNRTLNTRHVPRAHNNRTKPHAETNTRRVARSDVLKGAIAGGLLLGASNSIALAEDQSSGLAQDLVDLPTNSPIVSQEAVRNKLSKVQLRVYDENELAVSIYPHFTYNARGAGGMGKVEDMGNGLCKVKFDPKDFSIPPLDFRSTKVLGLPIPPPLRISIDMQQLEGVVNTSTGDADLEFESLFRFTVGSLYEAAPLIVRTTLSTGSEDGVIFGAKGEKLSNGRGKLVGIARVPKTGDAFLDNFLMLPTDCLAVLSAELDFA